MTRTLKILLVIFALSIVLSFFIFVEIDFSSKTSLLIATGTFTAAIISLYIANSNWKRETEKDLPIEENKRILFLSLCEVTIDHFKEAIGSFNKVKEYCEQLRLSFDEAKKETSDRQHSLCDFIYREIEFNKIKFDYVNFNLII